MCSKYVYDAWGNCAVLQNTDNLAEINPFRYRGYYYDTETGFYYLKTRYYDPEIRRFINADNYELLPELAGVLGQLNLYAYCNNNPVMRVDPNGNEWWNPFTWDWEAIGKTVLSVLSIAGGVALCFVPGAQAIGAGLIIFGAGGIIGGIVGAATGYGYNSGWNIGSIIGGAIGLTIAAPQLISLSVTLPTFGFISTTAGSLALGITGSMTIAIGKIAVGVIATGLFYMAYQRQLVAPRVKSGTRKEAYEKAFQKGGKKEPTLHFHGKYGPHFHPAGKFRSWHYYFSLLLSLIFNGDD